VDDLEPWRDAGLIGIPLVNAAGRTPPAWRQQLQQFAEALHAGTILAVLGADPTVLTLAEVTGPDAWATLDGVEHLARSARFDGTLARRDLPVPASLQNPRRLFAVAPPREPGPAAAEILQG
jgi:hypothetical protein